MDRPLADIDLIDRLSTALEQARVVSLAINNQLDAAPLPASLQDQLAGEIGVVHTRILDAQALLDDLASRCRRPDHVEEGAVALK